MDELAQLDGLTNRLTITCPQLDAIHRAPPHWIRIAWGQGRLGLRHSRNSLSTFPQRSLPMKDDDNSLLSYSVATVCVEDKGTYTEGDEPEGAHYANEENRE